MRKYKAPSLALHIFLLQLLLLSSRNDFRGSWSQVNNEKYRNKKVFPEKEFVISYMTASIIGQNKSSRHEFIFCGSVWWFFKDKLRRTLHLHTKIVHTSEDDHSFPCVYSRIVSTVLSPLYYCQCSSIINRYWQFLRSFLSYFQEVAAIIDLKNEIWVEWKEKVAISFINKSWVMPLKAKKIQ